MKKEYVLLSIMLLSGCQRIFCQQGRFPFLRGTVWKGDGPANNQRYLKSFFC